MDRMKTIGLVGGVASGKSLVAKLFAELGAGLLDADRAGHEVLANDPEVRQAARRPLGPVDPGRRWQHRPRRHRRSRLRRQATAAATERAIPRILLHPRIRAALGRKNRANSPPQGCPAVVLDAPLLLEAGWGPLCDLIVMVDSPTATCG